MRRDDPDHWKRVARIAAGEGPADPPAGLAARAADAALDAAAGAQPRPTLLGPLVWLGARAAVAAFGLAGVLLVAAHLGAGPSEAQRAGGSPAVAADVLSSWWQGRQGALEQEAATLLGLGVIAEKAGPR